MLWSCHFFFGRRHTNLCRLLIRIKIIPALSDNYMPLGIKDVHAKVFYIVAFSSEDVFTKTDLQVDFGKGGFTNSYAGSRLRFMKVQSLLSACFVSSPDILGPFCHLRFCDSLPSEQGLFLSRKGCQSLFSKLA